MATSPAIETIRLAHVPTDIPVFAALYKDVANAEFLRGQLLAGNEEFEYAFVDASMILSRRHVLAAVFRAINDYLNERLKSRNVHSEIVFALSSNNNIGEAFRRFGVSDTTTNLLVIKLGTKSNITLESVRTHLTEHVKGTLVSFDDENLHKFTDLNRLRKVHKLSAASGGSGGVGKKREANGTGKGEVEDRIEFERQVLGVMAIRGAN